MDQQTRYEASNSRIKIDTEQCKCSKRLHREHNTSTGTEDASEFPKVRLPFRRRCRCDVNPNKYAASSATTFQEYILY